MSEKVFMSDERDSEMIQASKRAQDTFKYFWRELSWENRRIVPALDLACVKTAFYDENVQGNNPKTEHMWISDINFDGINVTGVLLNSPNWITTVKEGDSIERKLDEITDWMFAIDGKVYGAFTVNLMRKRMSPTERKAHDKAWGLDFGDPENIEIVYKEPKKKKGIISKIFSTDKEATVVNTELEIEHPMSLKMGDSLINYLKSSPDAVHTIDDDGMTPLHREALAGNLTSVRILVEYGSDMKAKTPNGLTALDLAKQLNWEHIISYFDDNI